MSDEDNQLKPVEFQARLKYKVGNTYKYLTIDEFDFDKIRNMNMYDREKEKFIQRKQRFKPFYIWKDEPEKFKEFKAYLDELDKNETRFKIPYSSYYFTYDNLNAVIKEKQTETESNFSQYNNDYSKFFILNKDKSDQHIRDYFQELKKNLDENIREANKTRVTNSMNQVQINDWNNDNTRKDIVNEYSKYILNSEEIAETDANKLYDRLKSNDTKMKNIITYHNIFKILERFYLNPGCILKQSIYEDKKGDIVETKNPIYIKIKNITPVKLTDEEIQTSFGVDILKPVYEIEFEKVHHFSKIQFNISFTDQYNPDTLKRNTKTPEKITDDERYELYKNDLFYDTDSEKRTEKDIYINTKLDYNKLLSEYSSGEIVNIKDVFLNFNKFNKISGDRYKLKEKEQLNPNDIIKNYYVEQFFFKKGQKLNHNKKFAKIKKASIKKLDTNTEQSNYFTLKPSPYIRLAVDDLQSIYSVYIDLEVTYRDTLEEKIPIKMQYKRAFGCIQRANTIDGILHDIIGNNYAKHLLEEKMRNRSSTTEKPEPSLKQNSYQSGGVKAKRNKTRARRGNKNRRTTLKKIIQYYA
ncbi:hypothetical protein PGAG_00265 [Phaeocystis globosa virus 12T]|uniref:Uncharacterized protein n=1 Tax=Phaeocystis globosa virus PgV-16T TaxID=3071227 RepID=A0AC59EXB7_9VIRU|nr:hypothetical protein PGCG_00304 [Phaeocystis globosa virus]AET73154.1 hypothetical protein PGAG_00265 [Phaeocystis globosa virus 12T]AET73978.1 hypothetical protein PGBG_00270 [Phaeocystis globosa virus 14T]AGM15615.1 hypothetical protein PGCG_00304 [Phaeocystis globosa virus PgV-16T]UYE94345.1 hypothetical protein PGV14T_00304 [Phaeocystis globosa virus]